MTGFADNIRDATAAFTDEELGILRRHEPVTENIVIKILDGTMRLAMKFFLLHPNGKIPPAAHDLPYSFIFRFALCAFLHALHWRVRGGAGDRLAERLPHFQTRTDRKVNSTARQSATEKGAGRLRGLTSNVKPRMRLQRSVASLWSLDDRQDCLRRLSRNSRSLVAPGDYAGRWVAGARKA
jgi:hypothetical protein